MATKKKQQTQVNNQFTGSYVQNLVGNQPAVPTAQVQANVINPTAVGGNSYQAYVNSGAAVTPTAASAVTPTATGATEGQYTRSLVQPKKMKAVTGVGEEVVTGGDTGTGGAAVVTDDGSSGSSGERKLEVEDPNSYIAALREREDSIVEQYDASVNYAEETKQDAYKKAEDQYNIAMREAQANFRANQPTYGARAEQLLASGLTGSGYSDYLAGKAYEARTNEINAARSQQSYAQYLADSNYRDMMYQANTDKYNQQAALDQWKLEYGVQLDAEYKAKVDEVLAEIKSGDINAAVAETKLKNYAPNGVVSQNILDSLKAQEEEYWRNNNNSITTEFISWVAAREDAGKPVNAAGMRQWLKDNTNLTDDEVEFWISTYTDANGNYEPDINYKIENGHIWISTDGGKTWKDYGEPKEGGQGGDNPDTGGKQEESEAVLYLREAAKNGLSGADAYNAFKTAMNKHDIGDYSSYKKLIDEMDRLVAEGKFDANVAAEMKSMINGLVVGSGVFEENRGLRKKFQDGDNFTVKVNDFSYKVESGGVADSKVIEAAKDLKDGVVFGYGSELYLKSGDTAYKIEPRPVFGNKDYDKLWSAVYGEAIKNLGDNKGYVQGNEGASTAKQGLYEKMLNAAEEDKKEDTITDIPSQNLSPQIDPAGNLGMSIGKWISDYIIKLINKKKEDNGDGATNTPSEDSAVNDSNNQSGGGTGLEGMGGTSGEPNGDQNANINNNVTTNGSYSNGGNNVASDIGLALSEGKKTLTINDTTYGVTRKLPEKDENNRWVASAVNYGKNVAPGTVFVYKDASGDHWCYRDFGADGEVVVYELGTSGFMTFSDNSNIQEEIDTAIGTTEKLKGVTFKGNGGGLLPKLDAGIIDEDLAVLSYNNKNYRVKLVAGDQTADANAILAGKGYNKGDIYKDSNGNIWISLGLGEPLKVVAREGVTLYGNDLEKLNNAIKGVKTETAGEKIKGFFNQKAEKEAANANNAENTIDRAYNAGVSGEGLSDKSLAKGDWFTIDIVDIKGGNTTYRVKSGGAVDENAAIYTAAKGAGIYDGEVFAYGDEAYVMRKGKIYSIDTRLLSPKQEEKLVAALGSDVYAPEKNETSNGQSLFVGDTKSNTTSVNNMGTYNANDTIKVSGGDGKSYNVKVASVLNGSSEAYLAAYNNNIAPGTAFIYRGSVYVMGSTDYQNAAVYKLKDNTNARKLAEFLTSDFDENAVAVRTSSGMNVSGTVTIKTAGASTTSHNNNWALDNYPSGTDKYVAIQIPDVNGKLDAVTKIDIVGKYGTESNAYKAAENAGFTNDEKYELFLWNGTPYVWLGEYVAELDDNSELINYLNNNQEKNKE